MAKAPSGRPTADHVDPKTPIPAKQVDTAPKPLPVKDVKARQISDVEIKVKTSGGFVLMDPFTAKHFYQNEATPTPQTQFVVEKLNSGELVEA